MMMLIRDKTEHHVREFAAEVAARVETAMRADLNQALSGCDPFLVEVLEYGLFGGGKRIRPLLAVLSSSLCGREDDSVYSLAVALEYLHVATLIHDDVIDHAQQRRGRESLVSKYGMAAAILAGDWLHARSMRLVGRLCGSPGLEIFCQATAAMVDGEFLQLRYLGNAGTGEDEYFSVIARKTGILIASTCTLGVLLAGGNQQQQAAIHLYGEKLGAAFQVVDDLLDYQGDEGQTGKKLGNDFVEGKVTLPVMSAMSRATSSEREEMMSLFAGERSQPEAYQRVFVFVERLGGFQEARARAEQLVAEALEALQCIVDEGKEESYGFLCAIAHYILERKK